MAGLGAKGVVAPWVLDGPINGDAFETSVRRVLVPELKRGDSVIMDNLQPQAAGGAGLDRGGRGAGALPSAIQSRNPIEKVFAKLKALLPKAAERTVEGLWRVIGRLVDLITPAEPRNYFESCGYEAD